MPWTEDELEDWSRKLAWKPGPERQLAQKRTQTGNAPSPEIHPAWEINLEVQMFQRGCTMHMLLGFQKAKCSCQLDRH